MAPIRVYLTDTATQFATSPDGSPLVKGHVEAESIAFEPGGWVRCLVTSPEGAEWLTLPPHAVAGIAGRADGM
ncbi:hypothetical protein ABZ319_08885 [Nocardia sp. NPDC005978]|uniref:hypothetical protein n=1 Tax=Nocardia sp. NPDC005978 TaxID=3156725 RepID=UPI0033A13D7C